MSKEINFDEISKEIKREISIKMKEELPNLFKDINGNDIKEIGTIIGEALKISMNTSMKYTDELVKRVLAESNQESDNESK